jgi:hypothetical protein
VPGNALAAGTPAAAEALPGAGAVAVGRAGPPNIDGWPLDLFQPSHSRTSEVTKTTHNRVRRISVMGKVGR